MGQLLFKLLPLSWVMEWVILCMDPFRVESLFPFGSPRVKLH